MIEKNAGFYDRAVEHLALAAELAANPEERLWKRLYWAWYIRRGENRKWEKQLAANVIANKRQQTEINKPPETLGRQSGHIDQDETPAPRPAIGPQRSWPA